MAKEPKGIVTCASVDNVDRRILFGEKDGSVELFHILKDNSLSLALSGQLCFGPVLSLEWMDIPYGPCFLCGGFDGILKLVRPTQKFDSFNSLAQIDLHSAIFSISTFCSATITLIACGLSNGKVVILSLTPPGSESSMSGLSLSLTHEATYLDSTDVHLGGCSAVSFERITNVFNENDKLIYPRLVSCGLDGSIFVHILKRANIPEGFTISVESIVQEPNGREIRDVKWRKERNEFTTIGEQCIVWKETEGKKMVGTSLDIEGEGQTVSYFNCDTLLALSSGMKSIRLLIEDGDTWIPCPDQAIPSDLEA
ncbi:hypothetical protein BLNAU_14651 [Blattamonas nauphoetae]|uniref:Uncharacterized protein n=1 Tax=Blattamonas nauphoetae TaxID=2049346 RepID=A0ABQ9XJS8_9EUKA|nr:hypothetical protein BLNAU_14651 [Blattamonas nauphoetae]